jgi:hypothetical protein
MYNSEGLKMHITDYWLHGGDQLIIDEEEALV